MMETKIVSLQNKINRLKFDDKIILYFYSYSISPIHTFVNIPALLLKNTLRFLIRAGILTKV